MDIVRLKVPQAGAKLAQQVVDYVQTLRTKELFKNPGVAETLDWATALMELNKVALDPQAVSDTLGVILKYQDDIASIQGSESAAILREIQADARAEGARAGASSGP